jgi:hypothetical protein
MPVSRKKTKTSAAKPSSRKKSGRIAFAVIALGAAVAALILCAAVYLVAVGVSSSSRGVFPGSNLMSEKIPLSEKQFSILTELEGKSSEISSALVKMGREANSLLLIDAGFIPAVPSHPKLAESIKKFTDFLAALKKAKPSLSIILFLDGASRNYQKSCPGIFAELVKNGVTVIFSDPSIQKSDRPMRLPLISMARSAMKTISGKDSDPDFAAADSGKDSGFPGEAFLERQEGLASRRNLVIADSRESGWEALTGHFRGFKTGKEFQMAFRIKGGAVVPLLKNELFTLREMLVRAGYGYSSDGSAAILRDIEALLKNTRASVSADKQGAMTAEFLTESPAGEKLEWMLAGATAGETVNITAGRLSDNRVIGSIKNAARRNCRPRIIFDWNNPLAVNHPGMPNSAAADELARFSAAEEKPVNIRWMDNCRTGVCFIQIVNSGSGTARMMLLSSGMDSKSLRGYDLCSAVYAEGKIPDSQRMADLFNNCLMNRNGLFGTSDPLP